MALSIYEFTNYKAFLLSKIASEANTGRGVRRKLAEFIGCQVAYVSHVLAGDRNFSLEQAEATARFFSLRDDETEFLFLLLDHARAGTQELKRHLQKRIDQRRSEQRELKKKVRISRSVSPADQAIYYSSWHFQAIRTLVSIPAFRTGPAIATRLKLSPDRVSTVLSFLLEKGLIRETAGGYEASDNHIHLPRSSPLISKLHSNWRVQTLTALENLREDDFHYSGLVTLSEKDANKIREILTNSLAAAIEVAKPSREENIFVMGLDFYEL